MTSADQGQPLVSIVIRCLNEEKYIGTLLDGIRKQSHQNVEIIVVDSGSTDGTIEIAQQYSTKLLHIDPTEFSFGRALNIGCAAATGEFILNASAHVFPVYRDWIAKTIEPFSDPKVALTYGKQRGTEESHYSERRIMAKWFPEQPNLRQTQPFCNNANAAIRRKLWDLISYNEELTGVEDTDWAVRAIALGHHLAYVADAEVTHNHYESPKRIYNRYRREAIAIRAIFPHEYLRWWDAIRLSVGNIVSDYYHALGERLLWKNLGSIPMFRLMQFWGAYRGFAQHGPVTNDLRRTFYYPNSMARPYTESEEERERERKIDYSETRYR
jgi:glycosyltransferase involved in cell wall biosynthesis